MGTAVSQNEEKNECFYSIFSGWSFIYLFPLTLLGTIAETAGLLGSGGAAHAVNGRQLSVKFLMIKKWEN